VSREILNQVKVTEGKYHFIQFKDEYGITVLRYGKAWLHIEKGSKAIIGMMVELDELRKKVSEESE